MASRSETFSPTIASTTRALFLIATIKDLKSTYHVRFSYQGRKFRRSLNTDKREEADNLVHLIEYTLGQLASGRLAVPPDVEPGDFILSGGLLQPPQPVAAAPTTTLRSAISEYKANRFTVSELASSLSSASLTLVLNFVTVAPQTNATTAPHSR